MKTKLRVKSCPFCGGEVEATHGILNMPIWYFKCRNRDCGAVISFDCEKTYRNQDEAFELYDRRDGNQVETETVGSDEKTKEEIKDEG